MSKLKVLIPLDGSEKSRDSLNWLKKFHSSEDVEVTLINVVEMYYTDIFSGEILSESEFETAKQKSNQALDVAEKELEGYKVSKLSATGFIPDVILEEAKGGKYDLIIMTKSSVKGISRIIGSVTTKVVRNSEIAVIVVPE